MEKTNKKGQHSKKNANIQESADLNISSSHLSSPSLASTAKAISTLSECMADFRAQYLKDNEEAASTIRKELRLAVAELHTPKLESSTSSGPTLSTEENNPTRSDNAKSIEDSLIQIVEEKLQKLKEDWESKWTSFVSKIETLSSTMCDLESKVDSLESYIRRPCLILHGLPEATNEDLLTSVPRFIADKLNISITPKDIIALHRLPHQRRPMSIQARNSSDTPAPVIVKFLYIRDRDNVFFNKKKLKGSPFSITENLTKKRSLLLKSVRDKGYVAWTYNGDIFTVDSNNRRRKISSVEDIEKYRNLQKFRNKS